MPTSGPPSDEPPSSSSSSSSSSPSSPSSSADAEPRPPRRAVTLAVLAGSCAIAAGAGVPAALFVAAPLSSKSAGGRWVRTLKFDQLVEGQPKRVAIVDDRHDAWTVERGVELGSVWVVRRGDKAIAFSSVCPHLGCSVNLAADASAGFACPCHTSAFEPDGKRKSGPSPRDLDALATRLEDGFVAVDFRRFRIGIAEKVEA